MSLPCTRSLVALLLTGFSVHAAENLPGGRRSGYDFMAPDTRAIQDDDTANPGVLWVLDGDVLWKRKEGNAGKSCADCHGDANSSMRGVAARYPAYDKTLGRPVDLEQRINLERTRHQEAPPFAYEGQELFMLRQGQLNLACSNCHDDNWDKRLAGTAITQAHPTGYPLYRLEWQSLGSLQRRLRGCITGIRAQPYDYGAVELVELELFMMTRAQGMKMESPAVRP